MIQTVILTLIIVAASVLLLGIKVFLLPGGTFPNTHIEGNKALRQKGIHCVKAQDREARQAICPKDPRSIITS